MLTGSYAVGETRADSDIDVVLLSELSNRQTTVLKTTTEDLEFTSFGHGTSYPYPSCFYEGLYLGGQLLYDELADVMSMLSNLAMRYWGKETGSYRLLLAYRFAYYYFHDVVTQKDMRTFLVDTQSRLMPEVLDTNGMYNTRQLLARKRKLLTCMDKNTMSRKKNYYRLWDKKRSFILN